MILLRYFCAVTLIVFLCAVKAYAQGTPTTTAAPNTTNKPSISPSVQQLPKTESKKQSINFEDELIEGSAQKPEFFYLFQKKNFNYKRLIRLRENFIPEMRRTSEDIQRLRGGR